MQPGCPPVLKFLWLTRKTPATNYTRMCAQFHIEQPRGALIATHVCDERLIQVWRNVVVQWNTHFDLLLSLRHKQCRVVAVRESHGADAGASGSPCPPVIGDHQIWRFYLFQHRLGGLSQVGVRESAVLMPHPNSQHRARVSPDRNGHKVRLLDRARAQAYSPVPHAHMYRQQPAGVAGRKQDAATSGGDVLNGGPHQV